MLPKEFFLKIASVVDYMHRRDVVKANLEHLLPSIVSD
jgi:hypothetical protein